MIFLVIVRRAQCEVCFGQFDLKYGESPPKECPLCNSPDWLYGTESRDGRFIRQGINKSSKILNPGVRSKKQHDFTKSQWRQFKKKEDTEAMSEPGFVQQGTLYKTPGTPGVPNWRQPGGPGTIVLPQATTIYPPRYEGYPQSPFAYEGQYVFGCGHWTNTVEIFKQYDPYEEVIAAILCCPVCSYIQLIVEPADQWWEQWYGLYNTGLEIATLPTAVE